MRCRPRQGRGLDGVGRVPVGTRGLHPRLLDRLAVLVEDLAVHSVVLQRNHRAIAAAADANAEESALDPVKRLNSPIATGRSAGVFVAGGSA